ncbi:MAG: glycoside hydrolase family 13 protein [Micrococcales bacterium]|nr:glycoside hydrolase family 13 protein [Micrococcales bacterium]
MSSRESHGLLHPAGSPEDAWWRHAVIYQVYPRSFADADGDGVGDLAGVLSRLDHLTSLGVDALWLSPFYPSPQVDGGYDVSDYCGVDPVFGTLAGARHLVATAHERGLRVLVDLVPNHTSDAHPWFVAALASAPGSPERARYLFRDGRGDHGELPPNNWRSIFGGTAWARITEPDGTPGQWYLHLFDPHQPDLDWSNLQVRADFLDILRFWLDLGVDGFRVDVAHSMVKAEGLPDWDEPVRMIGGAEHSSPQEAPAPMFDQEGVHEIIRSWRRLLDSCPGERAMVAEAWVEPADRLARYVRPDEMHQTFNFPFLTAGWDAEALRKVIIDSYVADDAVGAATTWVLSNHDVVRHASRFGMPDPTGRPNGIGARDPQPDAALGLRRARAATTLMLALPGSAYLYQGEELGLPDHTTLDDDLRQDPTYRRTHGVELGRDGCRIPMPWSAGAPALGFSPTGRTWLPQPAMYHDLAVDRQDGHPGSTLELYRELLRVRRERGLGWGSLTWYAPLADRPDVLAFHNGEVLVIANLGTRPAPMPEDTHVLVSSTPEAPTDQIAPDTAVWLVSAS